MVSHFVCCIIYHQNQGNEMHKHQKMSFNKFFEFIDNFSVVEEELEVAFVEIRSSVPAFCNKNS